LSSVPPPGSQPTLLPRPGAPQPSIDSIYAFTNKGLGELKAWIETWFIGEQTIFSTPAGAGAFAAPMAAAFAPSESLFAGSHAPVDCGSAAETRIPHTLGVEPIAVASPAQGTTEGVSIVRVSASESEVVLIWSEPNTVVAANVIAAVPS